MSVVRLKHVDRFADRHGRVRYYFRRAKGKRFVLAGKAGSEEFMLAYQAALGGEEGPKAQQRRGASGTFDRLVQDYFASADYRSLRRQTQYEYRRIIERMMNEEKIGHRLIAQMTRQHIQQIVGRRESTPAAANDTLKKLRILLHFAIDNGWRKDDPTLRIKKFASGEHHTWTDAEIHQYERRWAIGTRERTAFALLPFTGQRVSDVQAMSWQDIDGQAIHVVQGKTGAKLWIPLHPRLSEVLAAWPRRHVMMLVANGRKPSGRRGLSSFMAPKIGDAGLPDRCVTHGLRKAAARRLAEAGCSTREIAAITGHRTLAEIERYARAVEQKKLAASAMERLPKQDTNENSQTP